MRSIIQAWVGTWLPSRFKNLCLRILGHRVPASARVGMVLIGGSTRLTLGERARIGHFNVFKNVGRVVMADDAIILQFNWITAAPELACKYGTEASLELGRHSHITSRHYLDCSGGITIGDYTIVAGVRSTIVTHGIDWRDSSQKTHPVVIGDYVLVGSNAVVCPGAVIADRCVVGMGTVVGKGDPAPGALIASPRGTAIKQSLSGDFFVRQDGYVH